MITLPFYISNILAGFVKTQAKRHLLRGRVNSFFYTPTMMKFIKETYGEKTENVKFVRQHTPSRFVSVINNKYFIKVFKHNMGSRLKDFEFLVNYVRDFMDVPIPKVYVSKNNHMYVTEMLDGFSIHYFDKEFVLKHEEKIINQVKKIISQLQSINVHKIPDAERFQSPLEKTDKKIQTEKLTPESVLAHNDMNVRNFLFDKDLNICGLIDFDGLSITNDKNKDMQIFMKYWQQYKNSKRKHPL